MNENILILLLNSVIKHVLQQGEFNYHVKRADEDVDPGMIGDRVVTDIINSELVVADLTDLNPNAFYELGIRHSTEKPTIHIARSGTALPFDNIAHRTIFVDLSDWHSIEQARARLAESTRAINAFDYKVSNPITQANASFKMRQSEDPRDRLVAEIQEKLIFLESQLSKSSNEQRSMKRAQRQDLEREQEEVADQLSLLAIELVKSGMSHEQVPHELRLKARDLPHTPSQIYLDKRGRLNIDFPDSGFLFSLPPTNGKPKGAKQA